MAESITYRFRCGSFAEDTFEVLCFTGEEGVSQLYRFEIDLLSGDTEIDVDDLQDQPSTFTIADGAHERLIQGVAAEVEVLDQYGEGTVYRVVIVPRVWELTLSAVNAVYLDRTTPEIIQGTLEEQLGVTSADYSDTLRADYRPWPFRLQYGESYWDYLARLMERDGIYYYFVADEGGERIVFCDSMRTQPEIEDPGLTFAAQLGMSAWDEYRPGGTVDSLFMRQTRQPQTVWVQNYNDERPSSPIRVQSEVDPRGKGDINLYGQNVLDTEEAGAIAAIRAEELRCRKALYHGQSTVFRLVPGHRFDLEGHHRARCNQEYQLLSIEHSGQNPSMMRLIGREPPDGTPVYENRFTAIPADTQYRPVRTTDWPSIRGTLNAEVDAEGDGRFAELDDEGRYHIVFPFHRGFEDPGRTDAGKASHWVRLVQPYSGEREGMHFPLRKGARVLVGFIGGNPDLPVITGAIPTAEHTSVTHAGNVAKSNIQTQQNRIEIDDEKPRIKMQSAKSRTYMHLGSSNEPGDGIVSGTDGLARFLNFGGTSHVTMSYAWPEDLSTLDLYDPDTVRVHHPWYDGSGSDWSDVDAGNFHSDITRTDGAVDWDAGVTEAEFSWARDSVFSFPAKHAEEVADSKDADGNKLTDSNGCLTEKDHADGRHDLMQSRTIGVAYNYRAGMDFNFTADGYEAFSFGKTVSFAAAEHDKPVSSLRDKVTGQVPRINDDEPNSGKVDDAEEKVEEKGKKCDERITRRDDLRYAAKNSTDWYRDHVVYGQSHNVKPSDAFVPDDALMFESVAEAKEWIKLVNGRDVEAGETGWFLEVEGYNVPASMDMSGSGRRVFSHIGWVVYESRVEEHQGNSPRDGSVEEAMQALSDVLVDYRDAKKAGFEKHLKKARIAVNDYDQFHWHSGCLYDFGGYWNYNIGNSYEETHIHANPKLNSPDLPYDLLKVKSEGSDWDWRKASGEGDKDIKGLEAGIKANTSLPGEQASKWSLDSSGEASAPKRWTQDAMFVSKQIGDEYSYHWGGAIDVHTGDSQTVTHGGRHVEHNYNGNDILVHESSSEAGVSEERRRHPQGGFPLLYATSQWGIAGGHESFSMEFAPAMGLELLASTSAKSSIKLGADQELNIHGGYSGEISIFAGVGFNLSLALALKISLDFAAGGKINVENSEYTVKLPGIVNKTNVTDLEQKVTDLTSTINEINNVAGAIKNGSYSIKSFALKLQNATEINF